MTLPVEPKEEGAEARPVDAAVPLADVVFAEGSPVDGMDVALAGTLEETAVPTVPDG